MHMRKEFCEVEHGCFTPLIFSTSGGIGKATNTAYKHLADLLSTKRNTPYPTFRGASTKLKIP